MNNSIYKVIILVLLSISCVISLELHKLIRIATSSPVEEMYHRELVTTLDSILNARFGAGCCEEVIDSDDISITHDRNGKVLIAE